MLALPERLVRDPHAAARDEPDVVGFARAGGEPRDIVPVWIVVLTDAPRARG